MIINSWDNNFKSKYKHQFPNSYLCFDTEFTGRSERDDLILEIGHVLVENGKVVDKLNLVLNWYELDVPSEWLNYKLNQMRYIVGPGWRLTPDVLKTEGINPLQALRFYSKLFRTWADRGMPFVAQNGINADEPMLRGNLNRFLNKSFEIPANSYFDTGAIFKADQVWQARDGDLVNYKSVMLPSRSETLKAYFQRICNARIKGVHWSLKFILDHYDLIRKNNLDESQFHNAGFDAMCLHLIMQEYHSKVQVLTNPPRTPENPMGLEVVARFNYVAPDEKNEKELAYTPAKAKTVSPEPTIFVRKQRPI